MGVDQKPTFDVTVRRRQAKQIKLAGYVLFLIVLAVVPSLADRIPVGLLQSVVIHIPGAVSSGLIAAGWYLGASIEPPLEEQGSSAIATAAGALAVTNLAVFGLSVGAVANASVYAAQVELFGVVVSCVGIIVGCALYAIAWKRKWRQR